MASTAVVSAVEARLSGLWSLSPVFSLNVEGDAPTDGSGFIKLQFPVANRERIGVSDRYYRETGAFRIVILTPRGEGGTLAQNWADALTALFLDQKFGGVETQVPSAPFDNDASDDGNFSRTSIVCPYTFNFRG